MQTRLEAPAKEPLSFQKAVEVHAAARRFGEVTAIDGLDLEVASGEVLAVVGPSGCGKTTLLELIAGLQAPDAGTVAVQGESALMPQSDLLLPWRDALGNAGLALECEGVPRKAAQTRAAPLFERFGLGQFERAYPYELSGGSDAIASLVPGSALSQIGVATLPGSTTVTEMPHGASSWRSESAMEDTAAFDPA